MTDQTEPIVERKARRKRKPEAAVETTVKAVSFQASDTIHELLDSAAVQLQLDKAGVARLAVRVFLRYFYQGNGVWAFPPELEDEIIYATSSVHMHRGLPR